MAGLQALHIMMRLQRNFVAVTLITKYFTAVIYISFTSRVGDVYDSHITNNLWARPLNVNQLHIGGVDPLASPLPHLGRLESKYSKSPYLLQDIFSSVLQTIFTPLR